MIVNELEDLSRTSGMMSIADIIDMLNVIIESISRWTHAHIIDILWREQARGGVILRPVAWKDSTHRGGPLPYQIPMEQGENPTCVWTWVLEEKKPLLIKNIRNTDLNQSCVEQLSREMIGSRYLNFWTTTDAIIAIPLVYRGQVLGIFSIEFPETTLCTPETFKLMQTIARPIARFLANADWWAFSNDQTSRVVSYFSSISADKIDDTFIAALQEIALPTDFITMNQADQVTNAIGNMLIKNLDAITVDILWRQEGWHDGGGDILDPIFTQTKTSRGNAQPYQIMQQNAESLSAWTYVFENKKTIWIENVHSQSASGHSINCIGSHEIPLTSKNFWRDTDSILITPLLCRGNAWGVLSVELSKSGVITEEIVTDIKKVAELLTCIVWKADRYEFELAHKKDAFRHHYSDWQQYRIEHVLPLYRTGFFVRPFEVSFNSVEQSISDYFKQRRIKAHRYMYNPSTFFSMTVIDNVMEEINRSHFGIIDITGCNLNVMVELGMLLISHKKCILIQDMQDPTTIPFDINSFQCYPYELQQGNRLRLKDPGTQQYVNMEDIFDKFVDSLMGDPAFQLAQEWVS